MEFQRLSLLLDRQIRLIALNLTTPSRGFSPAGYPTKPLASYQIYRLLSGWNLPPLVIHAFGAHGQLLTLRLAGLAIRLVQPSVT
jgi:hypothetical protein